MKKLLFAMIFIITMMTTTLNCLCADVALAVLDDTESHCVLATISDIDPDYVYAELFNTVADTNHDESTLPKVLKIKKFRYSYCSEHADDFNSPKIGDNIFATVKKTGDVYEVTNAAYKTDTVDERTLNFYAPSVIKGEQCMDDIVALAYFVRSNGLEREYEFDNGSVYVVRGDDSRTKVYPADIKTPLPVRFVDDAGKVVDVAKQQDVINVDGDNLFENLWNSYNYELLFAKRSIALGIICAGAIFGMIIVYIIWGRKSNNR